jgi:tetratricopeptide (TPR) repeat protein
MQLASESFRRARVLVLVAGAVLALATTAAAQPPIAVAPADVDAALTPIGLGFDRWLSGALTAAGRPVLELSAPGIAGLDAAAASGVAHALVPRLREHDGRVELRLSLFAPTTGQVLASSRGEAPLDALGSACTDALNGLASALGIALDVATPPLVSELAAATRARELAAQGQLFEAWRAVQGRLAPVAMAEREALAERAHRSGDPGTERARLLAATGDIVGAWALVGSAAQAAVAQPSPDPRLMLAAAEVQLAQRNPQVALRFLDAAQAHASDSADLQIAIARARLLQNDRDAARAAAQRAAQLAPDDPLPADLLIQIDADRPGELAADWLDAGARAVRRLDADPARQSLERAAQLDPALAPRSQVVLGDLEARLGRPVEALAAYRGADSAGVREPEVLVAIGRAQRATGDLAGAEKSLRSAVELAPKHGPALVELGALLTDSNRAAEAVPVLRSAHEISANDAHTNLELARALRLTGANADAVEVLVTGGTPQDVAALRELAACQQAAGNPDAAQVSLERAIRLEPDDPALRNQLAGVLDASGDAGRAQSERAVAARIEGAPATGSDAPDTAEAPAVRLVDFDALVASFAAGVPDAAQKRVVLLGVREPNDWRTWLHRLTRPREPDVDAVERGLREAIQTRFGRAAASDEDLGALAGRIDRLFAFERQDSLSADEIATVNGVLGTDGVFVTRMIAHPREGSGVACDAGTFALETRLLRGSDPEFVQILAASDCVAGGLDAWATWNIEAFVTYLLLAVLVGYPVVRGWGTIHVRILLPDKTKGFFSIHVTKRSDQVAQKTVDKKTGREKIHARGRLDFLRRFEQHMVGRETKLNWIPARRADYTITVGGPLLDATGKQIIGHFLQEQKLRVRRGSVTEVEFDFRPRECAVEVKVKENGQPVDSARVAVAGNPSSLRYAREGTAYLYLPKGEYTVIVGSKDTVAEFMVRIDKLDAAIPLHVDLAECNPVFKGCANAVEPYLVGDLASAADALDAAGIGDPARRLRARLLERQGRASEAAAELEAAGDLDKAAALRASDDDHEGSAALYEQTGDLARAAAAHRAGGQWEKAARCYEELYDYGNALECWRELGNTERELDLLEKLGEYQDAAQLARELGDLERAIRNLQLVDARRPDYRHACRLIAELVSERGDHELAVAKFEEAIGENGLETASVDVLESYAEILGRAGKRDRALTTYETIQRRDATRTDLTARIQALRREVSAAATEASVSARGARMPAKTAEESRYELLEELGRGGMGVVYKARDTRLGRIVALKRLPDNLREHPTAVALFEREARAAAALNHRNIVTIYDAGQENGTYFISMELLEGRPLNDILARRTRLSARDTARIGMQIAAGLQYAHERKIVHRDIKTANLFFTRDQVVKIMDFGIAKSLEEVRRSTTVVGGTPYYMAPEQARGQGVDHRADLYAFGVTLFQLVTGSLPFMDGDVTYLHAHEAPPDPREVEATVPASLAELILRMMAKSPDERPADANEVAEALHGLVPGA